MVYVNSELGSGDTAVAMESGAEGREQVVVVADGKKLVYPNHLAHAMMKYLGFPPLPAYFHHSQGIPLGPVVFLHRSENGLNEPMMIALERLCVTLATHGLELPAGYELDPVLIRRSAFVSK